MDSLYHWTGYAVWFCISWLILSLFLYFIWDAIGVTCMFVRVYRYSKKRNTLKPFSVKKYVRFWWDLFFMERTSIKYVESGDVIRWPWPWYDKKQDLPYEDPLGEGF